MFGARFRGIFEYHSATRRQKRGGKWRKKLMRINDGFLLVFAYKLV